MYPPHPGELYCCKEQGGYRKRHNTRCKACNVTLHDNSKQWWRQDENIEKSRSPSTPVPSSAPTTLSIGAGSLEATKNITPFTSTYQTRVPARLSSSAHLLLLCDDHPEVGHRATRPPEVGAILRPEGNLARDVLHGHLDDSARRRETSIVLFNSRSLGVHSRFSCPVFSCFFLVLRLVVGAFLACAHPLLTLFILRTKHVLVFCFLQISSVFV